MSDCSVLSIVRGYSTRISSHILRHFFYSSYAFYILHEHTLRPMINVTPSEQDVYEKLEWLVKNKHLIATMQQQSIEFVAKHHNPAKVAQQYIEFWEQNLYIWALPIRHIGSCRPVAVWEDTP